jgi:hypothetical protein
VTGPQRLARIGQQDADRSVPVEGDGVDRRVALNYEVGAVARRL